MSYLFVSFVFTQFKVWGKVFGGQILFTGSMREYFLLCSSILHVRLILANIPEVFYQFPKKLTVSQKLRFQPNMLEAVSKVMLFYLFLTS